MWYQCKVNSKFIDIGIIKSKWLNDLIKEDTCKKHVSFESMDETIHSQYFDTCEIVFWKNKR
jgi:hypothetical protein